MRAIVGILGCFGVAVVSLALADTPTPAADSTAAAPSAAAPPAAAPAAAAAQSTAGPAKTPPVTVTGTPPAAPSTELSLKEKELLAQGYKMEMHHGERVYCRREEELGSRVNGHKICGTADQLIAVQRGSKEAVEQSQQRVLGPSGK